MIFRTYVFVCEDCSNDELFIGGIAQARQEGWAVARNRQTCYCPNCAPARRNVGRVGIFSNR